MNFWGLEKNEMEKIIDFKVRDYISQVRGLCQDFYVLQSKIVCRECRINQNGYDKIAKSNKNICQFILLYQ